MFRARASEPLATARSWGGRCPCLGLPPPPGLTRRWEVWSCGENHINQHLADYIRQREEEGALKTSLSMQKFFMIFSNITFSLQWGKHRSLVHFLSDRDSGVLCANDRSSICCSRRYPMLLHQQFPLYTKPIQGTFSEGTKEANKVHDTKSHNSPRTIEFLGSTVLKFWNSGLSIQRDGHQGGDCDACL